MKHIKEEKEKLQIELDLILNEVKAHKNIEVEAMQKSENDAEKIESLLNTEHELEQVSRLLLFSLNVAFFYQVKRCARLL